MYLVNILPNGISEKYKHFWYLRLDYSFLSYIRLRHFIFFRLVDFLNFKELARDIYFFEILNYLYIDPSFSILNKYFLFRSLLHSDDFYSLGYVDIMLYDLEKIYKQD